MPIQNVSDTARWVAVYRAMETARRNPLFRDPFAARLAGTQGPQVVKELKRGKSLAMPMIVRTAVFDELIMDRVSNAGVDTVINLAAGLDTRAWRLPLPPSLRWFDVDLPGMTEFKADAMRDEKPVCVYEAIAADLTSDAERSELLTRLGAGCSTALVISEGLLIYLTAERVAALARDLHAMQCGRWWLIDLANPRLLQIMIRSWGKQVAAGSAPFQFAPAEGTAFFNQFGWHEAVFRSGIYEGKRLHREMPLGPLWRAMLRIAPAAKREEGRRMSGFVLLERDD